MEKRMMIILALVTLLFLTVTYMGFSKYSSNKQEQSLETFQSGVQQGYERAVIQLAQEVIKCEEVPIRIGNQSINVIAVDCLRQ